MGANYALCVQSTCLVCIDRLAEEVLQILLDNVISLEIVYVCVFFCVCVKYDVRIQYSDKVFGPWH